MPNPIKYNTVTETLALRKGNFYLGTGDVAKGPTASTGFWNGITPPSGGYTIYLNKAADGPSIYVAANDSELISLTNTIASASYSTVADCLNWFMGQSDKMVLNADYEPIVTNGLVFSADAGSTLSYPRTGTTLYDILGTNNGTLTNGPTFSTADGGSLSFDGIDDYVGGTPLDTVSTSLGGKSAITVSMWLKRSNAAAGTTRTFFGFSNSAGVHKLLMNFNTSNLITVFGRSANEAGQSVVTTSAFSSTTSWYNITGVWNYAANSIQCYVNGSLQATTGTVSFSQSTMAAGASFATRNRIGAEGASATLFPGNIASTQIYTRALSASEILQNYNAQRARFGL